MKKLITQLYVQVGSFVLGNTTELLKGNIGAAFRKWVDEVPHDGIFKIFDILQRERLVVVRYGFATC